ncbi:hypothetical protein [Dyadobacter frigoris]|uniref:hypothetical protein n=1 Tax=Dyadobacter frigoris TaxID=2576211 RepID=UPI0014854B5C|nr:hypothetical protein [Dyadobacter frigoris]GLU52598.1 hypothetical protein Dfri01_20590 [Dyadobacter frigoris]
MEIAAYIASVFIGVSLGLIDWIFLLKIAAIAMVGIIIGGVLANCVDAALLKKGFGW